MIPDNPNELTERCLADLDRMMVHHRSPALEADFVDYSSARLLLERAIREAFNQGATYGFGAGQTSEDRAEVVRLVARVGRTAGSDPQAGWRRDLVTDPKEQIQAPSEGINESLVHSDNSLVPAVQWTGTNMADVLKFATHGKSCVNSFGDPCVISGGRYLNVEIGQWVFRDADEQLHVCSGDVLGFIAALVDVAVEAETARDELDERIRKALELLGETECGNCDHPAKLHDPVCTHDFRGLQCGCGWRGQGYGEIVAILSGSDTATNTEKPGDSENLITLTKPEWDAAARARLAELGISYAELAQMARDQHFTSTAARKLWVLIGGTLDGESSDG